MLFRPINKKKRQICCLRMADTGTEQLRDVTMHNAICMREGAYKEQLLPALACPGKEIIAVCMTWHHSQDDLLLPLTSSSRRKDQVHTSYSYCEKYRAWEQCRDKRSVPRQGGSPSHLKQLEDTWVDAKYPKQFGFPLMLRQLMCEMRGVSKEDGHGKEKAWKMRCNKWHLW